MAQWGKTDNAANSVSWVAESLNSGSGKAEQATNNTNIFGNVEANSTFYNEGTIVGQFGLSTDEMNTANTSSEAYGGKIAHSGWVLRREGTGGRAGRVNYEVLVATGTITGDASDDTQLPE